MPTFQIPQFIEEKPKIVGPLTLGQFLMLAGAGGISLMAYYAVGFFLWLLITVFFGGGALAMAFLKVGGRSLPKMLFAAFSFLTRPRMYTWRHTPTNITLDTAPLERLVKQREHASLQQTLQSVIHSVSLKKLRGPAHIRGAQKQARQEVVRSITGEEEVAERVDY